MKTFPYNRASREGRRLFKLLDVQFNKAELDRPSGVNPTFETYEVPSVLQCRANRVGFLISSNLSGIKRPQIRIEADVETAWGSFANGVSTLDFTHGQELPLTYVQPLEDDTLKLLIDAGLYRDERFEDLMTKLIMDELFDADADMVVTYLDTRSDVEQGQSVPVILVDPITVVHDEYDPSEHTTIANLVKRSAKLAVELRKDGVRTEELVDAPSATQDQEVFIDDTFQDVVSQKEEEQIVQAVDSSIATSSVLLDQKIDVTDKLKDSLSFDGTNEDDRIRDLKGREYTEELSSAQEHDGKFVALDTGNAGVRDGEFLDISDDDFELEQADEKEDDLEL